MSYGTENKTVALPACQNSHSSCLSAGETLALLTSGKSGLVKWANFANSSKNARRIMQTCCWCPGRCSKFIFFQFWKDFSPPQPHLGVFHAPHTAARTPVFMMQLEFFRRSPVVRGEPGDASVDRFGHGCVSAAVIQFDAGCAENRG